jgi:alkylation response protein AidB-like acyl-CoA dehydrogenase
MTFELSPQHVAVLNNARGVAQMVAAKAVEIDRTGTVPADIAREVATLGANDLLGLVIAVEQIAGASAAVAIAAFAPAGAAPLTTTGLRGAAEPEASPRAQLVLAAAALGIGKAAIDAALAELRRSAKVQGHDVEKPHWVVADVATDIEAARLLVYKASRTSADADIGMARLMASGAAARAVDAAVRVVGITALSSGSPIERLSRDVRALMVLSGTEEDQRAMAAEGLLPH